VRPSFQRLNRAVGNRQPLPGLEPSGDADAASQNSPRIAKTGLVFELETGLDFKIYAKVVDRSVPAEIHRRFEYIHTSTCPAYV
jgi:hypothetical protein